MPLLIPSTEEDIQRGPRALVPGLNPLARQLVHRVIGEAAIVPGARVVAGVGVIARATRTSACGVPPRPRARVVIEPSLYRFLCFLHLVRRAAKVHQPLPFRRAPSLALCRVLRRISPAALWGGNPFVRYGDAAARSPGSSA